MLFILTGTKQTGKTRWLQQLVARLEDRGIACHGVLAPGVWKPTSGKPGRADAAEPGAPTSSDAPAFEKLGINNVLLPQHDVIPFAQRADLAQGEGSYDEHAQAAQAHLTWHISDEALARVNKHFALLGQEEPRTPAPAVLIIDELGPLELKRDGGLTEAVRLLEAGPCGRYAHAVVVVRESLADLAEARFAPAWNGALCIEPTPQAYEQFRTIQERPQL